MGEKTTMYTTPVREGQDFEREAVIEYLENHLPNFPKEGELQVQQFSAGYSNLTYLIRRGKWEGVLRRPPNGPLPPKAHDMNREHSFLAKIQAYYPFVPKPYLFCDDESITGVPFYVMEYKNGIVLDDAFPPDVEVTNALLQSISNQVVDAQAKLHLIDYREAGLEKIGYPDGFLERQVKGWINRYEKSKVDDVPHADEIMRWLSENIPTSKYVSILHNDYKLNNIIFKDNFAEIDAILDWEMTTIGDPLFDLATTLSYWVQHDDNEELKSIGVRSITSMEGFISRDEFVHRYSLMTKRDVDQLTYYLTLTIFKMAVAIQQMYYRYKKGLTTDERYKHLDERIRFTVRYAYETMQKQFK